MDTDDILSKIDEGFVKIQNLVFNSDELTEEQKDGILQLCIQCNHQIGGIIERY